MSKVVVVVLDEVRQEALALLGAHRPIEQRVRERGGLCEGMREVHVACGKLFGDDARRQVICANAAVIFR